MSFRRRLTLFFVVIVVVPMVALGAIVVQLAGSAETGKADAALSAALDTALNVYEEDQADAEQAARQAAADPALAAAIRRGDTTAIEAQLRESPLVFAEVVGPDGKRLARAGEDEAVAPVELDLEQDGKVIGTLVASTTTAADFIERVRKLTGRDATVADEEGTLATSTPVGGVDLPDAGQRQDGDGGRRGDSARPAQSSMQPARGSCA